MSYQRALMLAKLALTFGRVERATLHEDGVRPETDTDHTVMLGLVACELAPAPLSREMIAAFAMVHDLVEVHAGDTQTLGITEDALRSKESRERRAKERLFDELGPGSWLRGMIAEYEAQVTPEARFVRLMDKVLPKLTHALNACASAKKFVDFEQFVAAHAAQSRKLRDTYPEFSETLQLLDYAMLVSERTW